MAGEPLDELRQWRDLDQRRDSNIRRAWREGRSLGRISAESGLTTRRVQQIIRPRKGFTH